MRNALKSQMYNIPKYSPSVKNYKYYQIWWNLHGVNFSPQTILWVHLVSPHALLNPFQSCFHPLNYKDTTLLRVYILPNPIKTISLPLTGNFNSIWHH